MPNNPKDQINIKVWKLFEASASGPWAIVALLLIAGGYGSGKLLGAW
jgi:hypothetical protein